MNFCVSLQIERTQNETKWKILNNKFNSKYENAIFKVTENMRNILDKEISLQQREQEIVLMYHTYTLYIYISYMFVFI